VERRVPMIFRIILFILLLVLTSSVTFADDTHQRQLVLVAAAHSPLAELSNNDVRRIYLGLSDAKSTQRPVPIGNRSDRLLYEVFLQKIVFMSARNYERQILSHVYQTGNQRLEMYENQDDIVQQLKNNPTAISYMWESEAKTKSGLRILQTIWEGNVE
jgi:hypothetical protein